MDIMLRDANKQQKDNSCLFCRLMQKNELAPGQSSIQNRKTYAHVTPAIWEPLWTKVLLACGTRKLRVLPVPQGHS